MIQIVLVSHGNLSEGMLNSYEMIAGKNENISFVKLTDEGIGVFKEKLTKHLEQLLQKDDIVIFSDIKGGTPFNEAYHFCLKHSNHVRLIPAMNLPMLLEVGLSLTETASLADLQQKALDAGRSALENITAISDENDEIEF